MTAHPTTQHDSNANNPGLDQTLQSKCLVSQGTPNFFYQSQDLGLPWIWLTGYQVWVLMTSSDSKNLLEKFLELKKAVFYWLLLAIIR